MTAIYSRIEGIAIGPQEIAADTEHPADLARNAVQLRQDFRELTPENQRLTLEFVRMLQRLQRDAASG